MVIPRIPQPPGRQRRPRDTRPPGRSRCRACGSCDLQGRGLGLIACSSRLRSYMAWLRSLALLCATCREFSQLKLRTHVRSMELIYRHAAIACTPQRAQHRVEQPRPGIIVPLDERHDPPACGSAIEVVRTRCARAATVRSGTIATPRPRSTMARIASNESSSMKSTGFMPLRTRKSSMIAPTPTERFEADESQAAEILKPRLHCLAIAGHEDQPLLEQRMHAQGGRCRRRRRDDRAVELAGRDVPDQIGREAAAHGQSSARDSAGPATPKRRGRASALRSAPRPRRRRHRPRPRPKPRPRSCPAAPGSRGRI